MKTRFIIILSLVWPCLDLFGHDQNVHEAITVHAADVAYAHSPGFKEFLNTVSADKPLSGLTSGTNSMRVGSHHEDFADESGDVGGKRSLNHFYDPLDANFDKGLSDIPPDIRGVAGTNSFKWASISNCAGFDYRLRPPAHISATDNVNTSNIWTWQNARGYEWLGLTATNLLGRQTNLDNMFRGVGQVMHLLEDTSQSRMSISPDFIPPFLRS